MKKCLKIVREKSGNFDRFSEPKSSSTHQIQFVISVSSKMLHQEVREDSLRSWRNQGKRMSKKSDHPVGKSRWTITDWEVTNPTALFHIK